MNEFTYTTYIRTTPQRLWQALTDAELTSRYWGVTFESDWQQGSPMTWTFAGVVMRDPEQVVLEAERYERLSFTWHTFTQEFGAVVGFDEDFLARIAAEPRSRVTFELEQIAGIVKLTLVHDGFEADSEVLTSISMGWPTILASLKSLLETGDELAFVESDATREPATA